MEHTNAHPHMHAHTENCLQVNNNDISFIVVFGQLMMLPADGATMAHINVSMLPSSGLIITTAEAKGSFAACVDPLHLNFNIYII